VLINLLGNAVKYTDHGSITLRCGARPTDKSDRVLLFFEVEDTGIGIALEDQERIFQPFEQVAGAGRQKGTGLGLAITRQVVELMGGSVELESAPGTGSCFRVELPVELTAAFEAKPVGRILGLEAGQPEYRILVVEDEPQNWMVLERLLQNSGFQVRVAENGEEGIKEFCEWRPHFIWMDLRMPVMDGMDAARTIRTLEGGRDVKIAAVTASGLESHRSEVLAAGLDDYVRKPYRPDEIFDCMARHLGVRYRRTDVVPAASETWAPAPSLDGIAELPASLRNELRDGLVRLDAKMISHAIVKIAEQDAALGSVLAQYAARLTYSPILNAIDTAAEKMRSEQASV
jgi:CheY-like chemotaxis protein